MNIFLAIPLGVTAIYLAFTMLLGIMSLLRVPRASFAYRMLASTGALLLCAAWGVVSAIALRLVGQHRMAQWLVAKAFKYTMALTTGVRFHVLSGQEYLDTRPNVFVGNHQTALDVLLLGEIWPMRCSVTAKKQLASVPFLGWFMALSGTVFIDRAHKEAALKAFEGAAKEMQQHKQSVFIFPEGTRSNTSKPELLGFKKGAFHLAVQAQVPIVPVVCAVYSGVLSFKEKRFRSGEIPVVVLPPIPTKGLTAADVDQLTRYTRELMLAELIELAERPEGQQAIRANPPPLALPASKAANGTQTDGKADTGKSSGTEKLDAAQVAFRRKIGVIKD